MPRATKEQRTLYGKLRKFAKKVECINYLGGKCSKCGVNNPHLLQFHHTNPIEKDCKISDLISYSWDKILNELNKCILLCCNCHQEEHIDVNFYNTNKEVIDNMVKKGMFQEKKIEDETVIELVKKGWSQRGIARKYNMTKSSVQSRIRKLLDNGLLKENETSTMKGWDPSRKPVEKITLDMILPLLNSGESILSISNRFDISYRTAHRKAQKLRQIGLWIPTGKQLKYIKEELPKFVK
jgi:predicted transcriptional regulator